MRDRELSKVRAGTGAAALVAISLMGLVLSWAVPCRAQEAAGGTNLPAGQVVTAYLDYHTVDYSFANWGLSVTQRLSAFPKEPALSKGTVIRGLFQLGHGTTNAMAFVWDRTGRKLYLDLNRNLDLTDDPAGVFSCRKGGGSDSYQTFPDVSLPLRTSAGKRQAVVDLNLYNYDRFNCSAAARSLWQGKVILYGQEWQVGLPENPFNGRASFQPDHLVLRPWSQRNKPFALFNAAEEALPFSSKLFVGEHAYQLQYTNAVDGGADRLQVQFVEQRPKLGELKITGQFVQRVALERGPYLVVLDSPGVTTKLPVGRYEVVKVALKKGDTEAYPANQRYGPAARITISEQKPAVLRVGGPLTNSVVVSKRGRYLALNYRLVGVDGAYELANLDRSHPPEFAAYLGDKKIGSGKFQYG
jgi:hypothetical protein